MNIKSVILLLIVVFCGFFLVINWQGIVTDVAVDFGFYKADAPLALIVLLGLGALVVICLLYAMWLQASMALEMRKVRREAQSSKNLAEDAEKSRFLELKADIEKLKGEWQNQADTRRDQMIKRIDELDKRFEEGFVQTINSLSSSVGELEDSVHSLVKDVADIKENLKKADQPESPKEPEK
ncbi:MAG TPA: hypothetical protein DCW60_02075 [Sutterella sp.]|nr:hypothetical protein [Sutterella sp.]